MTSNLTLAEGLNLDAAQCRCHVVCVTGLAVLVAMFIFVASTSDQLGPYSTTSNYHYGRGFTAVIASFLSANVAAVSAVYSSTRRANLLPPSVEH